MTTKQQIYEAANRVSYYGSKGGFVNTDGEWCKTRHPGQFKLFLEQTYGFKVIDCRSTGNSTAVATTADGLRIAWNGFCTKIG